MEEQGTEAPIRVVRKKAGHGGHHGGAWKVAYADFVTAMMALFIVLWIVGQSKQVKEYVANYFKDPGAAFENTKAGVSTGGKVGMGEPTAEEFLKRQEANLQAVGKEIMKEIAAKPGLAELSKQIRIEVVKEGLRIELLESPNSVFFDVGTANMGLPEGRIDEVRGYADTMLRNPADPLDAANRRISIILKFEGKKDHE